MRRFTFSRDFYYPKGSIKVSDKLSDAVAYLSSNAQGRPQAVVFYGKQSKPVVNYLYRSEAAREESVRKAFENRQAHAAAVKERNAEPSYIELRNKAIRQALKKAFGCNVRTRASRGTAYGWVSIYLDKPRPKNLTGYYGDDSAAVMKVLEANNIKIGSYDSADYGSGLKMHVYWKEANQ